MKSLREKFASFIKSLFGSSERFYLVSFTWGGNVSSINIRSIGYLNQNSLTEQVHKHVVENKMINAPIQIISFVQMTKQEFEAWVK